MKLVKRPKPLFKGERVVAVDPPFATHVSERWNRRINYYPGRTLTHTALNVEQHNHSSHLSLYGGQLSAGVVRGLELSLEDVESAAPIEEQRYLIQSGAAITCKGEDISLSQQMLINVHKLPVIGQLATDTSSPLGIGVVVLQPIVADSAAGLDDEDPCEIDPANDAFEDWQIVDGFRAAWYSWPGDWPTPLPPFFKRLRNRLAYIIYGQEGKANGAPLPWERVGAPLALVNILPNGRVDFIDRYAVVRQGGIPNPRQSLISNIGTPFLWQARLLGLSAHLQELRDQGEELKQALQHFQYLPPVGVLPPDIVDFRNNQSSLFPSQYTVEAAPIPLEQFEIAVEAAASAEPFDLFAPDRIKVLVPVAQQFFEPRLLKREAVDPLFEQTIKELLDELGGELGRRQELRGMAASVLGAMDRDLIPAYPAEDPLAVPGEEVNDNYIIEKQHDDVALEEVNSLYKWLDDNSPLSEAELGQVTPDNLGTESFSGVHQLIDDLQNKIDASNHKIDFGFLRVQTDIYRIRQMMLGNVEATRLATSPILANIAQGLSSHATQENLKEYFKGIASAPVLKTDAESGSGGADNSSGGSSGSSGSLGSAPVYNMMNVDTSDLRFAKPVEELQIDSGGISRGATNYSAMAALPGGYITQPSLETRFGYAGQAGFSLYQPSVEDVESQSPIVGESLEFRSTSVAERITDPPAPEARSYAVASKAAVYSDLTDLPINIDGIEIPMSGSESAVITSAKYDEWYKKLKPAEGEIAVLTTRSRKSNGDVIIYLGPFTDAEQRILGAQEAHLRSSLNQLVGVNKRALNTGGLSGAILSGLYDPHPSDGDEGAFLSVGVSALESTVSTLRKVERRINGYKQAVTKCRRSLIALKKIAGLWRVDINESQEKLREHRHDVTVARALLQEEQARVNMVNSRRQEILKNHVGFIGYMRPRTISLRKDMPAIQIHGEFTDPVPACLKRDIAGPDELQDMVNLFRDIPLKWLPYSRMFLLKLDSYHLIKSIFSSAKQKAVLQMQSSLQLSAGATTQSQQSHSKYGQAINNLVSAHKQSTMTFTRNKASLNLQVLEKLSWKEVSVKAQDELSLQDLIESGKGQSGLAQRASREVENIQDVAVCLYARMAEVAPAQRLLWADLLSEFDEFVSLKNLEVLPQWDQLDFELRRDLQRLNQWLFSRIDEQIPDIVSLMNDLVRVSILLASHTPVSSIINGHLPEPVRGKIGDVIKLAIDKGVVRIGMQVGVFTGVSMTVQGVVEDLNADEVSVKVTRAKEPTYHLQSGSRAQFYQANRVLNLLL